MLSAARLVYIPWRGYGIYMPKMRRRAFQVHDDLWDRALAVAHRRGETLSAEIRKFLVRYVKRHE
jgi:hypothetical protein